MPLAGVQEHALFPFHCDPTMNRLADETSPYLLQHRNNPVDWFPWGEEAFETARSRDVPILLSIGYSACHWCHVMERESFENPEAAALMNERFVNVKVDREERPDVDSLYMTAVQRMTGHGGWPMTVFITANGEPFYGGTYYPPEPRQGMPSFSQVLLGVSEAWRERRDEVRRSAGALTDLLRETASLRPPDGTATPEALHSAAVELVDRHDRRFGGFGGAPKFPQPLTLDFLLRHWYRTGYEDALRVVRHSLRGMARGGIYDHIGGGFHRYSVDPRWLVPHFEKMLYDNALLARLYLHAHLASGEAEFRDVAVDVLDYLLREMTSPDGGFYSAQDADSEGEEGIFYVWTPAELEEVLGEEGARRFGDLFGITPTGNFEGRNIPNLLARDGERLDDERDGSVAAARAVLSEFRPALLEARSRRISPETDDKVLTGWNAMAMRSFAEAARALNHEDFLQAARRNARFIETELWREGKLLRSYRVGRARIDAFLDDHALFVDALVSLYQADPDPHWIALAGEVAAAMLDRFWSEEEGIFYDVASGATDLVTRPRELNDSATPSGTSAAITALMRLGALTGDPLHLEIASRALAGLADVAPRFPQSFGELLGAMEMEVGGIHEVAIILADDRAGEALVEPLQSGYHPSTVVAVRPAGAAGEAAEIAILLLRDRPIVDGRPTAYVCRRFACQRPVTTPEELLAGIRNDAS